MSNVATHATAATVAIVLRVDPGLATIEIADAGIGMGAADERRIGSLGIVGLRERNSAVAGDLSIRRRERGGTILSVRLPSATNAREGGDGACVLATASQACVVVAD